MNNTMIDEWETWQYAQSLSANTVGERVRVLRRFAAEIGGPADQASPLQISRWMAGHTSWSAATRSVYRAYLATFFKWLQLMEYRADNPMLKVGKARTPRSKPRPMADAHLPRLLASPMRRKTRAMIFLAALAGMRVHEIAKVRGEDMDMVALRIYVVGKGGVKADIPMHPIIEVIATQMPRRGWWFPANSILPGQHVRSRSVSEVIRRAMRRAGVPGTPHSLRHWYGTTLVDEGIDLRTTQSLLRHQRLATTEIYTAVSERKRTAGIKALNPWRALDDKDDLIA